MMECEVHHFMPELSRGKVIGDEYEIEVICAKCNKHFFFREPVQKVAEYVAMRQEMRRHFGNVRFEFR